MESERAGNQSIAAGEDCRQTVGYASYLPNWRCGIHSPFERAGFVSRHVGAVNRNAYNASCSEC